MDRYAWQVAGVIGRAGYEAAVAHFAGFLRRQPPDPVATLAAVAIARLARGPGQ